MKVNNGMGGKCNIPRRHNTLRGKRGSGQRDSSQFCSRTTV